MSFEPSRPVDPITITSDPSRARVLEDLMRSYQADGEDDEAFRDFGAKLGTSAQGVATCNITVLDRLNKGVKCLTQYDETIKSVMTTLTQKTLEAKGKKEFDAMFGNEKLVDDLVSCYTYNSRYTLLLCTRELPNLIKSARAVHSCMADRLRETKDSKKNFNELKEKYHVDVKAVATMLKELRELHTNMLKKLEDRILKLDKKLELARTLKKVVNMVFIGLLSVLFVCTILAAAMTAPSVGSALMTHPCVAGLVVGGAVMHTCSPVLNKGRHWLLDLFQNYESTLELQKDLYKSMEAGTGDAIKELEDLQSQVDNVIDSGKNLSSLKKTEDITAKLADFHQAIEKLEQKRIECYDIVKEGKKQVINDFHKFMEALRINK